MSSYCISVLISRILKTYRVHGTELSFRQTDTHNKGALGLLVLNKFILKLSLGFQYSKVLVLPVLSI